MKKKLTLKNVSEEAMYDREEKVLYGAELQMAPDSWIAKHNR